MKGKAKHLGGACAPAGQRASAVHHGGRSSPVLMAKPPPLGCTVATERQKFTSSDPSHAAKRGRFGMAPKPGSVWPQNPAKST